MMNCKIPFLFSLIICSGISCSQPTEKIGLEDGYIETGDEIQLYYQLLGSASDTLVVLHGGPGAGINSFKPSALPLSKDFTLIFYDQRGGGKSTLPENTDHLKPEYFVEDLESVRKYFGLKKMNVLTHSFGSIVLAEYAIKYPEHIKKAVMHGSTGPIRSEMGAYYQAKSKENSAIPDTSLTNQASRLLSKLLTGTAEDPVGTCKNYEKLTKEIARKKGETVNYKGSTCDAPPEAVKYYYQYTAQLGPQFVGAWDYTGKLDSMDAPVLIVYGAEDSLAIPSQQSWTTILPNSELLLVEDASKGVLSDQPEKAKTAITAFFKNP
jgi:proline iminopeptidase